MPGSIPQKIQILKYIGEQGIVSVADVARHLFQSEKTEIARITMHQLGVAHMYYSGIKHGLWFIDKPELYLLLNRYFPNYPRFAVRQVYHDQIPHYLELNCIRTTFEHSPKFIIDEWWSEHYIRSLPSEERASYSSMKIPDAIFWRKRPDGSRQKYFLEYERSLKSKDRYEGIFRAYGQREDARSRNVLYICHTPVIREHLVNLEVRLARIGKLERPGACFQFLTLDGFYNSYVMDQSKKEGKHHEHAQAMVEVAGG